jgi:hypothetical protein
MLSFNHAVLALNFTLNPLMVINEKINGQRMPVNGFLCTKCKTGLIFCTACRKTTVYEARGQHSPLTCRHCKQELPYYKNFVSGIMDSGLDRVTRLFGG